jgi:hypothetical protein
MVPRVMSYISFVSFNFGDGNDGHGHSRNIGQHRIASAAAKMTSMIMFVSHSGCVGVAIFAPQKDKSGAPLGGYIERVHRRVQTPESGGITAILENRHGARAKAGR